MLTSLYSSLCRLCLALPLLFMATAAASAQTVINSVPYTISASGQYVLGTNLNNNSTTVAAILINAPNVDLDLNGFYVSGAGNTASNNSIILVADVANVSIRNGLVANDGFGIAFSGGSNSRNYSVENVTISRCYIDGVRFNGTAPGSIVRTCSFSNLGNSTYQSTLSPDAVHSFGGVYIQDNSIANVTPTGNVLSFGLNMGTGDFAVGNTISNCSVGILSGKYLNNLTSGCTTPFSGGINASGNN